MIIHQSDLRPIGNEEINFQPLFYTLIYPDNREIRATILVLHGMQEHSGRYSFFAEFLANHGIAVLTYDHIGHGKSVKEKDNLGFFQLKSPDKKVVNDARSMAEYINSLYPAVPHFILGHSMGSFIVRCLLQQAGNSFDGAIIVGTGGRLIGGKLIRGYFSLLNKFYPHYRTAFNKIFNKVNNRKFSKDKNDVGLNWLSVNLANRKAYIEDELCGFDFTNNGFYTLFSLYAKATGKGWMKDIPKTLPFLFISGENDIIGNFGKGVKQTYKELKKANFQNINIKLYPGFRHEVLNEDIKDEVYKDILKWINAHL